MSLPQDARIYQGLAKDRGRTVFTPYTKAIGQVAAFKTSVR
jgi:hypothetical protein